MNIVVLSGRLVRDPELVRKGNGKARTRLVVAVDRNYVDEEKNRPVDFLAATVWEKQAENAAKYLVKGQEVEIVGELRQNVWQDDEGTKHYGMDVVINEVRYGRKPMGNKENNDG